MVKVGEKAPSFEGETTEGKKIKLSDFSGKTVVLYFYPKDNTPGCTLQACNLRDNFSTLKEKGIVVVGISPDSVKSHQGFTKRFNLPFLLIADEDHTISTAYGVWGEKSKLGIKYMGMTRTTFLIDKKGIIQHILTDVEVSDHAKQIMELLK